LGGSARLASAQLARRRSASPDQAPPRRGRILTLLQALAWAALINAWTFCRFWQDKRRACLGQWRITESELLSLAFLGGTPAAFAARHLLRHKTRKQPFSTRLLSIALAQSGALVWLAVVPG
jgi:uncharacterized membrane protein YsdA (DUF1294 family)